jgi:hypothetical protein
MMRIGKAIELSQRGLARELFAAVWHEIGGLGGDPLHRCALAHSMADVQDDVNEELVWDLRAVAAADLLTDERAAQGGVTCSVAAFYPSLHLNLAECYRKLGDLDEAREHIRRGKLVVATLPDDGYGQMIRAALDRLADRLTAA